MNSLSVLQLILTSYFVTLAKGSCKKTVISLGSAGSAGSAVPRNAVPQISLTPYMILTRYCGIIFKGQSCCS